ncbi:hypothetical protein P43SY_007332 [Pythium insidiosum]|uniref:TatD related DNase n=1 Tax=Pythium insidiosum TaxID=114742 RepID=A0AAD5M5Z1_PYTIN|nr:hypothetical protein P43SY_007332 [Pythium insidiosum]
MATPRDDDGAIALFDFDCNLMHEDLRDDVETLLECAAAHGVTEMLVPGATIEESEAAVALCRTRPATLMTLAREADVPAVGECGLDYSPSFPDTSWQKAWFSAQLDLACTLRKPLFLHERLAHGDFLALIDACRAKFNGYLPPAVVHCFTGTEDELREYVRRDFYIGVTGYICKKDRGAALREMLHLVPLHRLVIETDAPYMGFPKCRSNESSDRKKQSPNVPSALPLICTVVAEAVNKTPREVAQLTRANARRFLRMAA